MASKDRKFDARVTCNIQSYGEGHACVFITLPKIRQIGMNQGHTILWALALDQYNKKT